MTSRNGRILSGVLTVGAVGVGALGYYVIKKFNLYDRILKLSSKNKPEKTEEEIETATDLECSEKNAIINRTILKDQPKVVDKIEITEGEKANLCRCWLSQKFPQCDGSHNLHNKKTGDNVGPVIVHCTNERNVKEDIPI